jgi:sterol desaturase/sphingolipid hydroxylase (fatty acid hydroxylase superfamily)
LRFGSPISASEEHHEQKEGVELVESVAGRHGIHHSIVLEETDSNWSSGLTVWDWLYGTLRLNLPQQAITIGVPAYDKPEQVTLPKLLALPFENAPSWQEPGRPQPERPLLPLPKEQLLS